MMNYPGVLNGDPEVLKKLTPPAGSVVLREVCLR